MVRITTTVVGWGEIAGRRVKGMERERRKRDRDKRRRKVFRGDGDWVVWGVGGVG